jgi:branched-chain amino acid aminotransferase
MSGTNPAFLWLNGKRIPWADGTIHVSELAWSTVAAVFEGIRAYWNAETEELHIFRLREHFERLERSMKLVRLPLGYSLDELTEATVDLIRANEVFHDSYIFPLAFSDSTFEHRYDHPDAHAALMILVKPMPTALDKQVKLSAQISTWRRISEDVMPPRVKNISNYRNSQLARSEAMLNGYDTALLLNNQGKVSEAPGACVMMIRDGKLVTPDLTSSVLESITRDALLVLARQELGLTVEERPLDRTELYLADEVFICGTAAEVTPITSIDHYTVADGEIGPITARIRALYARTIRGQEAAYRHWNLTANSRALAAV